MKVVSIPYPITSKKSAMDNIRLVLLFSLAFVILLIYQAWMEDYGKVTNGDPRATVAGQQDAIPGTITDGEVPDVSLSSSVSNTLESSKLSDGSKEELIKVETDLFEAFVSTRGGTINHLTLKRYVQSPEEKDRNFQLFKANTPNLYLAQSGILTTDKTSSPNHNALFKAEKYEYRLAESDDELSVVLTWTSDEGVKVTKTYVFRRNSYVVNLTQKVENRSASEWIARSYTQFQRSAYTDPNESSFIYTYTGTAIFSPEKKYEKITFDDIAESKLEREISGGWSAMLQHYFVGAWIPPEDEVQTFYTNYLSGPRYIVGSYSPVINIAPNADHKFVSRLYIGPKLQNELATVAEGLDLTVDYGWLTILAQPIFWLLNKLHSLVGNWGVAIILLTILIKLAFYKLSETSYKSMANMRKMTPRMQALKDRFGDDKERLNQAMMEMYKKEKINPLGGCLPIMVQIPVFIALYWVLLESVEMRQAPFTLWLDNLSAPDPYFILPLLMGASMFIQQKLNPAPVDPLQAKMMMSLPFVFTVFFAFFPSGLVLYWTVNNILSIAQQWYITQNIEKASTKA